MFTRVKSGLWVSAFARRCSIMNMPIYITRRGDEDAGTILLKADDLNNQFCVYGPAIGSSIAGDDERQWQQLTPNEHVDEQAADAIISQHLSFDPDIWVVVIEGRNVREFLIEALELKV